MSQLILPAGTRWDFSAEARDALPTLYGQCKHMAMIFAKDGKKLTLQCSKRTFEEHLNAEWMIAGPWDWHIDDRTPFGKLLLCTKGADELVEGPGLIEATVDITAGIIH